MRQYIFTNQNLVVHLHISDSPFLGMLASLPFVLTVSIGWVEHCGIFSYVKRHVFYCLQSAALQLDALTCKV